MFMSLVVPCYNEADVIDMFYAEVTEVMKLVTDEYEIIFVDDGSTDSTKAKLVGFASESESVKYISFSRNFGKEAAMLAGLKYAKGKYVGILDADLQHPPSKIADMVKALESDECDVAAARRVDRSGEGKVKSIFSKLFYGVINKLADVQIQPGAQDFRIMKKKVADSIVSMPEYHRFSKGIFSWIGFKTKWFSHNNVSRPIGKSKWSFFGLLKYGINGIVAFSIVPLRLSLLLGMIASAAGFAQAFVIIRSALFHVGTDEVGTGFASIMSAILLLGGMILVCLGIIGEYVARIYIEVKKRPNFIIDETNIA